MDILSNLKNEGVLKLYHDYRSGSFAAGSLISGVVTSFTLWGTVDFRKQVNNYATIIDFRETSVGYLD